MIIYHLLTGAHDYKYEYNTAALERHGDGWN